MAHPFDELLLLELDEELELLDEDDELLDELLLDDERLELEDNASARSAHVPVFSVRSRHTTALELDEELELLRLLLELLLDDELLLLDEELLLLELLLRLLLDEEDELLRLELDDELELDDDRLELELDDELELLRLEDEDEELELSVPLTLKLASRVSVVQGGDPAL